LRRYFRERPVCTAPKWPCRTYARLQNGHVGLMHGSKMAMSDSHSAPKPPWKTHIVHQNGPEKLT
jgi:hypothetical protein